MIIEQIPMMRSGRVKSSYKILCRCEDCNLEFRRIVKSALVSSIRCKSCTTTSYNLNRDPAVNRAMLKAAADVWRGKKREEIIGVEQRELERQRQSARNSGKNNPNFGGRFSHGFADHPLTGPIEMRYGDVRALEMRKRASERSVGKNNPMYGKSTPKKAGNGISGWWKIHCIFEVC